MASSYSLDRTTLLSRPVRVAAELLRQDETALLHLFEDAHVLIRLEQAYCDRPDAWETFLFTVNQVIRFCPNVAVCVPAGSTGILAAAHVIAARVHGRRHAVRPVEFRHADNYSAVVNIGSEILEGLPSVTVNSTGWVSRVATAGSGATRLPRTPSTRNPIGALGAACLGTAHAFLFLVGQPRATPPMEISLFTLDASRSPTLPEGPRLPSRPVELDGLLVGCGAVANGWAYTVKRLPITGRIDAIDRQALRIENIAPYVAASQEWLGRPKAAMIASLLGPTITVTPRAEDWELFKLRLSYGLRMPSLVVNGLDNVETRHSVQRLWPGVLVDMAAGGLTSQVIVKPKRGNGICLLRALDRPPHEVGWADRAAQHTGLHIERILEAPTTPITEADVAEAPTDKRATLERARQQGRLVCGRVTEQSLLFEPRNTDFSPAVPFATGFSGVVAAAATMKWLMGYQADTGFHFQHSFATGRSRRIKMLCDSDCECQVANSDSGTSA